MPSPSRGDLRRTALQSHAAAARQAICVLPFIATKRKAAWWTSEKATASAGRGPCSVAQRDTDPPWRRCPCSGDRWAPGDQVLSATLPAAAERAWIGKLVAGTHAGRELALPLVGTHGRRNP